MLTLSSSDFDPSRTSWLVRFRSGISSSGPEASLMRPQSNGSRVSILAALACASYLGEQSSRCDEIGRIQALAEPTVDRSKQFARGCAFSLTVQQLGQVSRRSQFP